MNQSEFDSILAAAIEPIADLLGELADDMQSVTPKAIAAAQDAVRLALAEALADCYSAKMNLQDAAHRCDRDAQAMRADVADALLRIERLAAQLRDGRDGVGIRAVSIAANARSFTLEFTDDTRFECPLPQGEPGDRGEPGAAGIGIDAPLWQRGVYRAGAVVQHYEGRTYRAIEDTSDEPGDAPSWQRLGCLGLRWCGPYQEGRAYEVGDLYVRGGTFHVLSTGEHRCLAPKPLSPSEVRTICANAWRESEATLRTELAADRAALDRARDELAGLQAESKSLSQQLRTQTDLAQAMRRDLDQVIAAANQLRAFVESHA